MNEELYSEFPLQNVDSCVRFLAKYLEISLDPNLSLCSVLFGFLENALTRPVSSAETVSDNELFPTIELSTVNALVLRFQTLIKGSVDLSGANLTTDRLTVVKRVSDVIWNYLSKSYRKDRAHLQSLFSFLTGRMLDAFGVAIATVAGCQVLGMSDVHLAIAEDHVWLVLDSGEEMEVTWHGKAIEDRRKQPVDKNDGSWLYLRGHAVVCSRHMELAALVTSMNPVVTGTTDSFELTLVQKELLWLLYDKGHLNKYPMALGTLSDLEQLIPSSCSRKDALALYQQAVDVARSVYCNSHIYPYLYLAHYYYRRCHYKEALANWTRAACVISRYDYGKEDEEIYKDLKEVADLLPSVFRPPAGREDASLPVDDPQCYAMLLRFIDGLCKWEEGSSLPVLHEGWATNFVIAMTKFTPAARMGVTIARREGSGNESSADSSDEESDEGAADRKKAKTESNGDSQTEDNRASLASTTNNSGETITMSDNNATAAVASVVVVTATGENAVSSTNENAASLKTAELSSSSCEAAVTPESAEIANRSMGTDILVSPTAAKQQDTVETTTGIKDIGSPTSQSPGGISLGHLTRRAQRRSASNEYYGGIKISSTYGLNDLSGSVKRVSPIDTILEENKTSCTGEVEAKHLPTAMETEVDVKSSNETATQQADTKKRTRRSRAFDHGSKDMTNTVALAEKTNLDKDFVEEEPGSTHITFKSEKMYGLRHIVVSSDKLNTTAVKLLLTAQSHVHLRNSVGLSAEKRTRTLTK